MAEGITGVRAVEERIEVRSPGVRSDGDIAAEVRRALARDHRLDGADIAVAVERAAVTLSDAVDGGP